MTHTATWRSADHTVEARLTCEMVKDHYGVPGSPVFDTSVDVMIDTITVLGVEISPIPDDLYNAVIDAIDVTDLEWEWQE